MTDAPKRIQVRWTKSGTGHVATPASAGLVANCAAQYLSTEALASSPEVAKLIREAEARGMERAAGILDVRADVALVDMGASAETVDALGAAADAIRAAAAAIRSEATK